MDKNIIINGKDKRAMMLAELEKWNSAEQIVFLVDSMKFLSFSLIKFITAICNDLIEKQTYIKTSRLNNTSLNSNSDFNNNNNDSNNNQQYSNILEEQANDILYFRLLSEKPIETKLKIMLSYLPLLKAQTQDFNLNESLRKSYQDQFQEVFKHCFRNKIHLVECYELSILASLHPIFDESQQMNFKAWVHLFECSLQKFNDQTSWQNQKLSNKQVPSIIFNGYCNNDSLLKNKNHVDSSYYSLPNDDQHNGTSDNLNDYKLHNFENELINNDFNIDSASASLNLSLHMQTTQTAGNNNNNNNSETNINDSNAESTNQAKRLLTRQHMPLKLSTSLPPQNSNANNNYSRGFSSLNPYEDINSSASSMNSFTMNLKSDSSNNKQNDQNYSLNSYSDFDYLNLDNIMIPPLSSSSSSVQSVISSQFAGSNFTNKSTNVNKISDSRKDIIDNGIKIVTQWLKHLRLHKYTDYFSSMSYDEIMSLNDEKLIESKITLGARKKILTNIEKLKNRPERIKQLINVINDEKCPLNVSTLENILNELTEISITPMKQQNSPPTSLALLNSKAVSSNDSDSNDLAQLFIDLLDKIQKFLIKQKSENCKEECDIVKIKELTLSYVKIIDKLFLTKAFSDVQNSQMAKLRNTVFDKNQTSKTDNKFSSGFERYKNFPIYHPRSSNNNLMKFIERSTDKNIFKPYQIENVSNSSANFQSSLDSNVNSQNALQRIKTRSVRYLSKTNSLPFSDNTLASSRNQSFMNYSNQNKNNN